MHHFTAGLLLVAMLVPAFGPLALARLAPPEGMHCMRRPLAVTAATPAGEHVMHCHHASSQAGTPREPASQNPAVADASLQVSIRSLDCCCGQHCDCCRGAKASEWARPASNHLSFVSLLIEPARRAEIAARVSAVSSDPDSARAPPRG